MSASVGLSEHFRRLFDFSGREDRASFWPYAAVAVGIVLAAGAGIFIPMLVDSMHSMQRFATAHPDQATVTSGPGQYSIAIHGDHPAFISAGSLALFLAVTFGLAILLYAAAIVRRLRDRGKSGLWGLLPLPFILYSSVEMPMMFATVGSGSQPNLAMFFSIFISNLLYLVTLVWLIVLLAGPSEPVHLLP